MSVLYNYIKNQYFLGAFSKEDLITLVSLGRITEEERLVIIGYDCVKEGVN